MTTTTTDAPRIYVASLTDYNAGRLHGVWIDATDDPDTIAEHIAAMLAASPTVAAYPIDGPAEEYAVHDYDGFGPLTGQLGEYADLGRLHAVARLIAEHGEPFVLWMAHDNRDHIDSDDLGDRYLDEYRGTADTEEDYAQQFADDIGAVPDDLPWPLDHIDWTAATRHLFQFGDYYSEPATPHGRHIFEENAR